MPEREPLVVGAFDLHRHGRYEFAGEISPALGDVEDITLCRDAGMAGAVLKSHMWPTMGRVELLRELVPDFELFASITLNPVAGGLSADNVALAGGQGARVVYLPTWGARHDREQGGLSAMLTKHMGWEKLPPEEGLSVVNARGLLTPQAREVLEAARQFGMVIFTGHISPSESLAVAESGLAAGRLVFSHPDSPSVGATAGDVEALAGAGAVIELCALGAHRRMARISLPQCVELISRFGPANCVITSDYFFHWSPPSHELMNEFLVELLAHGVPRESLNQLVSEVPQRLLGKVPVAEVPEVNEQ